MKKGIIAIASVVAMSMTVVSCNWFASAPKPIVDSPKTTIDTTNLKKDSGMIVIDSTKKDSTKK